MERLDECQDECQPKESVETVQNEFRAAMNAGQEGLRATVCDGKEYRCIEASHRQLRVAISVSKEEMKAKMKASREEMKPSLS